MRTRLPRLPRLLGTAAGAGAGVLLTLAAAAPAEAAGYRYWSYWESDGGTTWAYATQGPATARPSDGDAIGFRFAVSEDAADAARPTAGPDFSGICGGTAEKSGTKRVAVVIDFGTAEDAPQGETPPAPPLKTGCAQVRTDATSAEALAAVAKPLRYDSAALLCGIAGYPAKGCGEQVAAEKPGSGPSTAASASAPASASASASAQGDAQKAKEEDGGPSVGILVGGAAVAVLGGAALWKARRRA
ncbi:SCO2322 family protein [Streptomyces sp. NPDC047981]|uniref:SCO2322 family protein n=1 Tax=Streptomyces sp. NPDC047981 TaxID=3154610 RepID=UPI0034340AED